MNKEYTYIDGKVIIRDEEGNQTQTDYYDNLEEALVTENLIEVMEKRITELEERKEYYEKNNSKRYIPKPFLATTIATLISSIVIGTFIPIKIAILCSSFCFVPFSMLGITLSHAEYSNYKDAKKREKGVNSELEFLRKAIEVEKEELNKLRKEKTRDKENTEFRTTEISNNQVNNLLDCSNLYFDLGYNGEKYYRYYEQGKLDEKMAKKYTELGIQVAKEYLEEKGPTLVKRKNNKR